MSGSVPKCWLRTVRRDKAGRTPLSCADACPFPRQKHGAFCLQEDAVACSPESSLWPPSPVTHTGSVQNLCLKTLDVKKGRAEADRTTEIGPWRRRRSEPFFCTKLSARDPNTRAGERRRCGLSIVSCILPVQRFQPLLDPEPGKSPESSRWEPEPKWPRLILGIRLFMGDVRQDSKCIFWSELRFPVEHLRGS